MQCPPRGTLPSKNRKKLLSAMERYAPMHSQFSVPYGVPLYIQEAYPHDHLTLTCNKSKIKPMSTTTVYQNDSVPTSESSLSTISSSSRPVTPVSNLRLDAISR